MDRLARVEPCLKAPMAQEQGTMKRDATSTAAAATQGRRVALAARSRVTGRVAWLAERIAGFIRDQIYNWKKQLLDGAAELFRRWRRI